MDPSPEGARQLAVRRFLVRTIGAVIGLIVAYVVVPFEGRDGWSLARTAMGIVLLALVLVWQLRSIRHAPHPRLRAAAVVALAAVMSALGFASGYLVSSHTDPASFNEPLDHVDGLYLSLSVLSTVGFGDIHAVTSTARVLVMLHIVVNITVVTVAARMAFAIAGQAAAERNQR